MKTEEPNGVVEEPEDTGRRRDPELLAVERCVRELLALPEESRGRAVAYLGMRFREAGVAALYDDDRR